MHTICRPSHAVTELGGECGESSYTDDVMREESWAVRVNNPVTRARSEEGKPDNLVVQANC